MDARIRCAFVALAAVLLAGCAVGAKLGWTADRTAPSEVVQANCEAAVRTLKGQPDHDVAMKACVHAKTRQGVN